MKNLARYIFDFLVLPLFLMVNFSYAATSSIRIHCFDELKQKTNDIDWITDEMLALMCGPIERYTQEKVNSFSFIQMGSDCLHQLNKIRPLKQTFFDYAILCSGVIDMESVNNRFACVGQAYKILKRRWSERDKYILCSNVYTKFDSEKALSCYHEARKEILETEDAQVYAILCSGGKR